MEEKYQNSKTPFERLPESIREWFLSPQVLDALQEINEEYVSEERDGLSLRLLVRLATKKTYPQNFLAELIQTLKVPSKQAKEIVVKIKKTVLDPVKYVLKHELEIDINLIELGGEEATPDAVLAPAIIAPEIQNLPRFSPNPKPNPPAPSEPAPVTETAPEGEAPLIIHEEKSPLTAAAQPVVPSFNYQPKEESYWRSAEPKPITVRVETPKNVMANPQTKPPRRIVHYSNFRTPLESKNKE